MSLITSCPACGTMFRVVPDQLKISEGWVRCGHCSEVFDATAYFVDEEVLAAERAIEPTRPAPMQTRPAELPTRPAELPTRPGEIQRDPSPSGFSASSHFADSSALEPSPLDSPFVFRRSDLAQQGPDSSILPPAPDSEPAHDEELHDVSFMRSARRKAFWRKPMVRLALAFFSLLLATGLLLQVAYHDRDRLALAQPHLRPVLAQMCDLLDCRLGAPRQIEAIVIENSGFNRLRNDTYRLAFTLRNTARVQVAAPAMELTVTDSQDQPLARRVLTPAELGAGEGIIAPAGEWSGSVGLALSVPSTARVAGYRLLAFYP
jgi:predicted Zn finger-like uncharacterized protein